MAVKIRLSRGGRNKLPHYRVVVADSRNKRDGKCLDNVGHYHPTYPKDSKDRVVLDIEAMKSWISKGAQMTDRVRKLFDKYVGEESKSTPDAKGDTSAAA